MPHISTYIALTILLVAQNATAQVHPLPKIGPENRQLERASEEKWIGVDKTVPIGRYFQFMDSLVTKYSHPAKNPISEHVIVWANPWIIDALAKTDYYRMMEKDSFVYDQSKIIVLQPSDSLKIPDSATTAKIRTSFEGMHIDINIPEFRLRIYREGVLLHSFPIRVGQNTKKYLAFGKRVTDLRTKIGKGSIVGYQRFPDFYNPVNGKRFYVTKRDDGKTTMMPQIPWIETEINGIRNGQMIHPTTNPVTLEKAYSNGCIAAKEGDAWVIYYHAPIGTPLVIRYDLTIKNEQGEVVRLKDVYKLEY